MSKLNFDSTIKVDAIVDALCDMDPQATYEFLGSLDIQTFRTIAIGLEVDVREYDTMVEIENLESPPSVYVDKLAKALKAIEMHYSISANVKFPFKDGAYKYEVWIDGHDTFGGGDFKRVSDARIAAKQHIIDFVTQQVVKDL